MAGALADAGLPVLLTREPGGAPGAEAVRDLLLGRGWDGIAECLLHFAARREHAARMIEPALAAGIWVVCDRFADSTLAYQVHGQGVPRAAFDAIAGAALQGLRPDLTLVLDVPPGLGMARVQARGEVNRYDRLDAGFHERVRDGFAAVLAAEPGRCLRIDASATAPEVAAAILGAVTARLLPA
ncbi:dTMP kinase [Siccirubricoccus deserti]